MMTLSRRLERICQICPKARVIADIGTDHGYVPARLLELGKADKAIASDINKGPLTKAKELAQKEELEDRMEVRLGSGLSTLKPGEVQGVILAGMGAQLMIQLILDEGELSQSLDFILFQPAQNPEVLRQFLYEKEVTLLQEDLVEETDGRFYEYFLIDPKGLGKDQKAKEPIDPMDFKISPRLMAMGHPLLKKFISEKIRELIQIQEKISGDFESAMKRRQILAEEISMLTERLNQLGGSL